MVKQDFVMCPVSAGVSDFNTFFMALIFSQ